MKDVVLLAASIYLLKRDLLRAAADVSPAQNGIVRQEAMQSAGWQAIMQSCEDGCASLFST